MQPYYQQGYHATTPYSNTSSPVPPSLMGQTQSSILAPPLSQHAFGELPPEQRPAAPSAQPQKRKQVKNACTNCQKACKKCDDARPCPRCIKYNIADTCVNSVRKERKKGVKRGPYKRRQKDEDSADGQKTSTTKSATVTMAPQTIMGQPHMDAMSPYSSMRQPTTYTYANTLTAYGQGYSDAYNPYAAYQGKDHMIPHSYMIAPNVYSSFGYPMLVPGASDSQHQQQQAQQQQPQQKPTQQHPPQTSQSSQQAYTPSQAYSLSYPSPQPARMLAEHLPQPHVQQQQQPGSPAHIYYAQQHQQQQSSQHPQQTAHPNSPHMLKPQPMTPLPSTSTSSSTSTPPETTEDPDGTTHFARLTQLCTAALGQNGDRSATPQPDGNHS